jgi:hypothetical protein
MTTTRRIGPLAWALAALAGGCGGALGTPRCADGSCGSQTSQRATVTYSTDRRVDLLFVVDDTPAIAPYADRVAAGLTSMANELQDAGQPLSLHVGFARAGSCDTSTRARACGVTAPAQFVDVQPCNVVANGALSFPGTFACLGALGAGDCAPNQPIANALQALDPSTATWQGFLRPDAYLMVVVVAATDDASGPAGAPTPAIDLARRLKAVKADPSQVMVTVIGPGGCAAGDVPAPRLSEFAAEFGAFGLYMSLCADQLSYAVERLVLVQNDRPALPCLTSVRDTDAATPGLQESCTVVQRITETDTGTTVEQAIPSCDDGPPPCWHHPNAGGCASGSGWAFSVEGVQNQCVDGSISINVECLSCADPNDPACALQP